MFVVYETLLFVAFLLALPWFVLIGFLRGKYFSNFSDRLAFYDHPRRSHDLWIHAVSVGEVQSARTVATHVLAARPATSLVVTTTTLTGQTLANRYFPDATVTFFPFDFTVCVGRFLDHHQPAVYATVETELWPNVSRLSSSRGIRMILTNGRISDRSYPRYRWVQSFVRYALMRYERVLAREEIDRTRFISLGAPEERVEVTGNVKFDFEIDQTPLTLGPALERMIAGRNVFVAGSTAEGEDEQIIPILEALGSDRCFVILAPRKPERFEVVAALLVAAETRFVRRSEIEGATVPLPVDVLLLDSIGELGRVYRYATCAFVGGSLVPRGGQNPIEPAAFGVPVAFGAHMTNFREIVASFMAENAATEVAGADDLRRFVQRMIGDPEERARLSAKTETVVKKNKGAAQRTAARIVELLGP